MVRHEWRGLPCCAHERVRVFQCPHCFRGRAAAVQAPRTRQSSAVRRLRPDLLAATQALQRSRQHVRGGGPQSSVPPCQAVSAFTRELVVPSEWSWGEERSDLSRGQWLLVDTPGAGAGLAVPPDAAGLACRCSAGRCNACLGAWGDGVWIGWNEGRSAAER